jgi:hypothetical protein
MQTVRLQKREGDAEPHSDPASICALAARLYYFEHPTMALGAGLDMGRAVLSAIRCLSRTLCSRTASWWQQEPDAASEEMGTGQVFRKTKRG